MDLTREALLLAHLRLKGRIGLTNLSRLTAIPVSTLFDYLKTTTAITRYTCLLNFPVLGLPCTAMILLRTTKSSKLELGQYLTRHPHVNTLHKINNGHDYCLEGIFSSLNQMEDFIDTLDDEFTLRSTEVHHLLQDLKREGVLTDPSQAPVTLHGLAANPRILPSRPARQPKHS